MFKGLVLCCAATAVGVLAAGARQAPNPANGQIVQGKEPVAAATNAIGPKIRFASALYDFGRMRAGEPVKYTYVFTNVGDATLILTNVQPQCGCTTAGEWSRQVEPGKTGSIPIQFNTAAYSTAVFKQITVTCNDKSQPVLFLQLKGTVYKPLDVMPPMAMLNLPADADTGSVPVTITNHTEEPLMLWGAESNNKAFSAELTTNALGKGYQLKVSVVSPLSAPGMSAQISMKTSWTNQPVLNVAVYASKQPAISVVPSYLTLPPSPFAVPQAPSVAIQNNSTNPVALTDASVNAPGVEVQIKENEPGKKFTVVATFPQGFQIPAGQQMQLTMKSSNPKFPELKVPIMTQQPRPGMRPPLAKPQPAATINPPPALSRPVKTSAVELPPLPDVPTAR
jgi:copper(I)-binding protein